MILADPKCAVMTAPAYVPKGFPGRCKIFPMPREDGSEPLFCGFQRDWIFDKRRMKIAEKSRQIGWTWCSAYAIDRRHSLASAVLDTWLTSRDEIQSLLFVEDAKKFANILQLGAEDLGEQVIDGKDNSARILRFANGTRIFSMSSNPDAQAGKRGHRVADEFAVRKSSDDVRKLFEIMKPGVTWGGIMEIFSTHRGSQNYFNTLIEEVKHKGNPKKFSLHTVTLLDALRQGLLYKLQSKLAAIDPEDDRLDMDEQAYFEDARNGMPDEESFQQEYMCVPADDTSAFLPYDLIASCEYKTGETWELPLSGQIYVGVDVGRERDFTVIWVLEKQGDVCYTRRVIVMDRRTFAEQEAALYKILELPNVHRCCIDRTGIGRQFAERAQERFGSYKVEPINFTITSKEEMAYPLRAAFEDRTLRIPESREIRADLRSIKKIQTTGDHVRFAADRGVNGHADRFWALALALQAAKGTPTIYEYERVGAASERFGL
jgi:phage FluMu gp28-like protein